MANSSANQSRHRRHGGFTLMEMIAFIVVVGIAGAGLAGVFTQVMQGTSITVDGPRATLLAQGKLEEVLARWWDDRQNQGKTLAQFYTDRCTGQSTFDDTALGFGRDVQCTGLTASGNTLTCGGTPAAPVSGLCVTVAITRGGQPLGSLQTVLTDY